MNRLCFILFVILILISAGSCKNKKEQAVSAAPVATQNPTNAEATVVVGLNLGNTAPEIALRNPLGNVIALSSLKGKMVLVDFWASWCGPCRYENPSVVKAYRLYKDKTLKGGNDGFTVYSVSLDVNTDNWTKAIAKDSLNWQCHVSDLKGWANEAAAKYSVTSIPSNFLINERGIIIINKNLRGEDLLNALDKLARK